MTYRVLVEKGKEAFVEDAGDKVETDVWVNGQTLVDNVLVEGGDIYAIKANS